MNKNRWGIVYDGELLPYISDEPKSTMLYNWILSLKDTKRELIKVVRLRVDEVGDNERD